MSACLFLNNLCCDEDIHDIRLFGLLVDLFVMHDKAVAFLVS